MRLRFRLGFRHLFQAGAVAAALLALGAPQAAAAGAAGTAGTAHGTGSPASAQSPARLSGFDTARRTALHGSGSHGVVPDYVTDTAWSPNWSGYVAYGGSPYYQVSSNWVMPGVVCNPSQNNWVAFWVGLDGWDSTSVEQTGAVANCVGGVASYQPWYEMYPAAPVYWPNPMAPGDQMSASVVYNGSGYVLTIADHTRGWSQTSTQTTSASRVNAEIVAEGPGSYYSTVNPMPNFGQMTFTGSTINNGPLLTSGITLHGVLMGTFPYSGYEWDDVRGIKNTTDFTVVDIP